MDAAQREKVLADLTARIQKDVAAVRAEWPDIDLDDLNDAVMAVLDAIDEEQYGPDDDESDDDRA